MTYQGEIEIIPGWDEEHRFAVMLWDRHRDSGHLIEAFTERETAIAFARGFEAASLARLPGAEIIELPGGAA